MEFEDVVCGIVNGNDEVWEVCFEDLFFVYVEKKKGKNKK